MVNGGIVSYGRDNPLKITTAAQYRQTDLLPQDCHPFTGELCFGGLYGQVLPGRVLLYTIVTPYKPLFLCRDKQSKSNFSIAYKQQKGLKNE